MARRGPFVFTVWSYIRNLGAMIDEDASIQVRCTACRATKRFTKEDLEALAEKVGRDYSLINRRCRCRLTPGCQGWNVFDYLRGVYRPLRDPETAARWDAQDRRAREMIIETMRAEREWQRNKPRR